MQRLIKGCARGALGLGAAALLLAGVPAQAGSAAGEPRLMAQSTAEQEEAARLEKLRQEEQRKKLEQQELEKQRQGTQQKQMRTRGAVPEVAPVPQATPPPGKSRFGAGVVRHGDPAETQETE